MNRTARCYCYFCYSLVWNGRVVAGIAVADWYALSVTQIGFLNYTLDRVLERHKGKMETVMPAEIEGQYEKIMHHFLPKGSHENYLRICT